MPDKHQSSGLAVLEQTLWFFLQQYHIYWVKGLQKWDTGQTVLILFVILRVCAQMELTTVHLFLNHSKSKWLTLRISWDSHCEMIPGDSNSKLRGVGRLVLTVHSSLLVRCSQFCIITVLSELGSTQILSNTCKTRLTKVVLNVLYQKGDISG